MSALENVPDVVRGPLETLRFLPGERIEMSGMSTSQARPERSQGREGDAGEERDDDGESSAETLV